MYPLTLKETILSHIKRCWRPKSLESVYSSMIKVNATQDCFLMNQFISACSTFSSIDLATTAFAHMENPNVLVYNALMRGCVHCCYSDQALVYYMHMLRNNVMPTSYSFSSLIKACSLLMDSALGKAVHGHVWKHGFDSHVFVQTTLVEFYSNLGDKDGSRRVFDDMPERDVFAWTVMISAHARSGDMDSAGRLFDEMPEKNVTSWNAMIDGYTKSGNVEFAEILFNQMPVRDIISWTTMMTCYSRNKKYSDVIALFHDMIDKGMIPDEVTMTTVVSACAHLGALDLGKELHLYFMMNGFDLNEYIGSSLIDMYAKCGSIDRSLLVFYKLQNKNLFCWNSMIDGLATHGYTKEVLRMFGEMERKRIQPNAVTFVSILTACMHAGFVEEGRRRFMSMIQDYCITPRVEHYGCIVDLLSKAGLLEDALEMIRNMTFEPNSFIWGALLNGCKLHKNLEIAHIAVQNLMVLEPSNTGHYSLLVSMYAEVNRWSEVAMIRKTMKDLGIEKRYPGFSWVEIDKKMHLFAASDKYHPSYDQVHLLLAELDDQLRLAGYVPELGSIL
ncbi:pentatricopeptide repeat-containing protein At1g06143-like [Abrus precatorius]|uniref:Pentatricopeptide repeat-containing protein At1g06143-like n=1 Tax=Abrus precatorius TaxID=3816 RepID=A0A8B8LCY1_ABRPR|nr:pentatricopeptide repeat-containing protein At1g06143-like [Abrus precatorius]